MAGELIRPSAAGQKHALEHFVRQQAHIFGEHAEDQPIDEVRNRVRIIAAGAKALGERCDVALTGIAFVEAGAAVALGAMVTSDALGRVVTAAPAAGSNVRVIGFALEASAAAGDVIRVVLEAGVMQG